MRFRVQTYEVNWWEGSVFSVHVVPFDELLDAWTRFAARVRTDLLPALPELAEHKEYGRWFREGEAVISELWPDDDHEDEDGEDEWSGRLGDSPDVRESNNVPNLQQPANTESIPQGVPQPATRALESAGYTRLDRLSGASEAELLKLHRMGQKAIRIVRQALIDQGLEPLKP